MVRVAILCCLLAVAFGYDTMVGGKKELDLSNADVYSKVQALATFAVESYNSKSNQLLYQILVKVTSATAQVVSGMSYQLNFIAGTTTCNKNQISQHDVNTATCPPDMSGDFAKCQVTFWVKPASDSIQITDHACSIVQKSMTPSVGIWSNTTYNGNQGQWTNATYNGNHYGQWTNVSYIH